jgi:transcription elongation factor Elf1
MKPKRNTIYNPGGLYHWRRKKRLESNQDEERTWSLTCKHCDHNGTVHMTLRQLRAANLICSECGAALRR